MIWGLTPWELFWGMVKFYFFGGEYRRKDDSSSGTSTTCGRVQRFSIEVCPHCGQKFTVSDCT